MKISTINLDFNLSAERQQRAIAQISADVIATQEDIRPTRGPMRYRERVLVRNAADYDVFRVLDRGRHRANPTTLGYRIRRRWFAWALIEHPDVPIPFYVISAHFPPSRMPLLYPIMERRLRAFLADLDRPWIVAGDWNRLRRRDPAGLRRTFDASFYGYRIDLMAVHPRLRPYVNGSYVRPRRHLHPVVTLDLGGRP